MIIVTGGFGLIGSNIIKQLNSRGYTDIVVVDNLENGRKIFNLNSSRIIDFVDKHSFLDQLSTSRFDNVEAVFHMGACSATTEWDGRYIMNNNYEYTKCLIDWSIKRDIRLICASSASVYGLGQEGFSVDFKCEKPINMYAYSKLLQDNYLRSIGLPKNVSSVRFFNVFGPGEHHKGSMASVIYHFSRQIKESGICKLFGEFDGYEAGQQKRDFIHVNDCVDVCLWLQEHSNGGIFNVGTSYANSFNRIAEIIGEWCSSKGLPFKSEIIPFPDHLKGSYQSYTCADLTELKQAGYSCKFMSIEEAIFQYLDFLNSTSMNAK